MCDVKYLEFLPFEEMRNALRRSTSLWVGIFPEWGSGLKPQEAPPCEAVLIKDQYEQSLSEVGQYGPLGS